MSPPQPEFICQLNVQLAPIREMGQRWAGQRRIIPIIGGTVSGPSFSGKILNFGADWQTVFDVGLAQFDTRYAFETDDGALIEIINFGYRHGPDEVMAGLARGEDVTVDSYYMRTHARLETGDSRYTWVKKALFLGTEKREKELIVIDLFLIL